MPFELISNEYDTLLVVCCNTKILSFSPLSVSPQASHLSQRARLTKGSPFGGAPAIGG